MTRNEVVEKLRSLRTDLQHIGYELNDEEYDIKIKIMEQLNELIFKANLNNKE